MKKVLLFAFVLIGSIQLSAQSAVENLFRGYKNDKGVISWSFQGDISSFFTGENEIKSKIENVDFVMFRDGADISESDDDKLKSKISKDNYELLVQARDQGKRLEVYGIDSGSAIQKVFARIQSPEANIYFFLTGEIYLEDLQSLSIDGLSDIGF